MKLRKLRKVKTDAPEDYFEESPHRDILGFHPHCYVQQLALAEAKQFDEIYALAHAPVHGDEE